MLFFRVLFHQLMVPEPRPLRVGIHHDLLADAVLRRRAAAHLFTRRAAHYKYQCEQNKKRNTLFHFLPPYSKTETFKFEKSEHIYRCRTTMTHSAIFRSALFFTRTAYTFHSPFTLTETSSKLNPFKTSISFSLDIGAEISTTYISSHRN